ncbi:hypothetical protein [Antarcticirhabdus aurantiaca]|uniref:Uncharacterized protein n=1 Tax=Antarcticirhabdus aurantiaca TaxID=2606717 RepID=A0ACD4NVY9_9HYPH|nr:hypothetical protein [Antarcticirhabdus aurantiaca]WAJ31022.1 hypothetical protein OXU80_12790 [Jeongeuplla avenae]
MIKATSIRMGAAAVAATILATAAMAQEIAPDSAPVAPVAPAPVQAAPDSGPPPADAPAAQSPSEMPVDEGTVNDLSPGAATGGSAPSPAAPTPPAAAPAPEPATPSNEAAAPSDAAGELASKVAAFDPYVEDVQVVGPWTEGDKAGVWRTVMVREADDPEAYRFFVQSVTDDGGKLVVRDTTEITELADIEGGIVGYRADEDGEDTSDGLTLFFDIVPSDGEISETYELHFFGAGKPYQFGPASN